MNRQEIHIGNYKFIADYYDTYLDMKDNPVYDNFIMLRNFTLMNDISVDNDIYFIQKSYFNKFIEQMKSGEQVTSIVFPIHNSKSSGYSTDYHDFNDNYYDNGLWNYDDNEYGQDVYQLYSINNKEVKEKNIRCNKIRLYHPLTKLNLNAVIDINNYINNIHFHYLCLTTDKYVSGSDTEFKITNDTYSEYIDIFFPNIDDLFKINSDGSYNTYFKEDLNIAEIENTSFIENMYKILNEIQYVPLNLIIQPSKIVTKEIDGISVNVKEYIMNSLSIENNYLTYPFNIVIFPYSDIDENLNLYKLDENLPASDASFIYKVNFALSCKMGFINNKVNMIAEFKYPMEKYFQETYGSSTTTSPIHEAYKYFNNVTDSDYDSYYIKRYKELYPENYWMDDEEILKDINDNPDIEEKINDQEIVESTKVPIDFLGFKITIATDRKFKHIIYEINKSMKLSELDDFGFSLNDMFSNWNDIPDMLIGRIFFIDRFLGNVIIGNAIPITKEWIKYMIQNELGIYKLESLTNKNINMKELDLSKTNINFINNINCSIIKEEENLSYNKNSSVKPKILYKPIFYRTQDLQTIKLRESINQNIGINLADYMTKVNSFKLIIENTEYIETGRNDIFVLFKINANNLEGSSGKYNIVNQDDEYISSGSWSIY